MTANKFFTILVIFTLGLPALVHASDSSNKTTGKCSPIISGDISGDFILKCDDEDIMPFFFLDLSCFSFFEKKENPDVAITNFYKFMKENNGKVVAIELLESPPAFCRSIDGIPKKDIVNRFKVSGEYYSVPDDSLVYRNEAGNFFRINITPKDHGSKEASKLAVKLTNDCGHACSHWRLVGIPSTTYISGDGSTAIDLEIAPRVITFSERYSETMDKVTRLSKEFISKNHFSFSKKE